MKSCIFGAGNSWLFDDDGIKYVKFPNFLKYEGMVIHCFTTRVGGVSTGECSTLNLGFNRNDSRENVMENYKRLCNSLGIDYRNMVFSNQVHEDRIRVVTAADMGKGIIKESDIIGYDGLVTNVPEVVLTTFYADCVPVFFLDPVKKVVALVHSGWRGTVKEIAAKNIDVMKEEYGSSPDDIETAIGPSIGQCCFEVGQEVYECFIEKLPWSKPFCKETGCNKWHIDLQSVIRQTLLNSGIENNRIHVSGICTKCNKGLFFSHRGDGGKTGSMAAIIQLKNNNFL